MDSSLGGSQDGFVTRLAPSGTAYEYSTYLGGTDDDAVYGVALDPTGATYVGGWTDSSDFPVTSRAAAETFGGVSDAFAAKLTADGQSIVYASYLGGDDVDLALEIAVDDSGALYLAGLTASPDFPVTHGPVKPPDGFGDGFVARLDPSGSTFTHSTPLGGSTVDEADGLAVGAEGAAYVTGFTTSDDFPITPGAFDATRDDIDAFVVTISVAPNPTTAEVSCAPDPVASGAEATCTVTVTDTAERPMNPVGTVELATAAAGTFTGSGSCELTPDATPATSSCSLGYSSAVSGAQRIDAFQESRNLLISKKAHADAIPGLEILANDVRCTHAAAIAQIDPDQMHYLRSHGLPEPVAKRLVIEGFLGALLERFEEGELRDALAEALDRRLEAVLGV